MQLKDIVKHLDFLAPLCLAEAWDNVGLLCGDPALDVKKIILSNDTTPAVLQEVIRDGAQLLVSYHPTLLKPITKLDIQHPYALSAAHQFAIYSPHTALDAASGGTNDFLAESLQLTNCRALCPYEDKTEMLQLVVFVPQESQASLTDALFAAGAGKIGNYSQCYFSNSGVGSFLPLDGATPHVGTKQAVSHVQEQRLEMRFPKKVLANILDALQQNHPYEEPVYAISTIHHVDVMLGQGRIGTLEKSDESYQTLALRLGRAMGVPSVALARSAANTKRGPKRVAVAAGAGDSLMVHALKQRADLFVTGELRHHNILAAQAAGMSIMTLTHDGSERAALGPLSQALKQRLRGAAVDIMLSQQDRSPWQTIVL